MNDDSAIRRLRELGDSAVGPRDPRDVQNWRLSVTNSLTLLGDVTATHLAEFTKIQWEPPSGTTIVTARGVQSDADPSGYRAQQLSAGRAIVRSAIEAVEQETELRVSSDSSGRVKAAWIGGLLAIVGIVIAGVFFTGQDSGGEPEPADRTDVTNSGDDATTIITESGDVNINQNSDPAKVELSVVSVSEPIACDGLLRDVALVSGLSPGEDVGYVISPPAVEPVESGEADGDGTKTVRWSCRPGVDDGDAEGRLSFVVIGKESGSQIEFSVLTAAPETDRLASRVQEPEFVCDGDERDLALVSGFLPGERVRYELVAPGLVTEELTTTPADEDGQKQLRWQCSDEPSRDIELVVHALDTGRSISVPFSHVQPD